MSRHLSSTPSVGAELQTKSCLSLSVIAHGMGPGTHLQANPAAGGTSTVPQPPPPQARYAKVHPPSNRVTVVDYRGNLLLDTLVRPTQPVSDYRQAETGLQPAILARAPTFIDVQREAARLIRDKIIIGYSLWDFLSTLGLAHPAIDTRDLALFMPFRRSLGCKPSTMIPLVTLVNRFMGRNIGLYGEIPLEHARAALDLFRSCEHTWEEIIESGAWPCALPPSTYANCFT
ncbi:hypothetical protein WOLCODRAFT_147504 [Wolfiporia cocos MD-104 SS10]|uniref:Exonuclease domain-containing protein n=1 Tax=Wolfiporia cocos (strain MD-104) TaxID=742152 RepID=A0A2H3IVE7_WOLCO|nr:hypothetical protein WOLCODRAFT_147504 [Wolfiporia cocos MD-104 SS10]